jgi:hypothetical protein
MAFMPLLTIATDRTSALMADGQSAASALTAGYHLAFVIATGLVAVGVLAHADGDCHRYV